MALHMQDLKPSILQYKKSQLQKTCTVFCHQHVPNWLNSFDVKLMQFIWPHDVSTSLPSMQSGQPVFETDHWAPSLSNSCHPGLRRCRAARPEIGMISLPVVSWRKIWQNHKSIQILSGLSIIYPYSSDFITQFFKAFFSFLSSLIWWENQLGSTLEPDHVHPVDDKASQHLCSCSENCNCTIVAQLH